MRKFYLPLSLVFVLTSCKESSKDFNVGFKSLQEFDHSRLFDTTSRTSARYFRPVKIDLFYPGKGKGDPLTYGNILDQYEKRMDYNVSADSCSKTSMMIVKMFGEYLKMDSPVNMLKHPIKATKDLPFPKNKFPLIIYAAGMNGSTWENVLLFERLVTEGYVIAAVSSVGKFPGFMSDAVDIEEQVKDILFTIRRMKNFAFIDSTKIGILSWSMGGTSAAKAVMSTKEIKCMASFDGTETHYYGRDAQWDSMFNQILTIPPYKPDAFEIPYLYLSSDRSGSHDSVYVFQDHIVSKDIYYLQFAGAIHEDFSSLPSLARKLQPSLTNIHDTYHTNISDITSLFFRDYLKLGKSGLSTYIDSLEKTDSGKYLKFTRK